MIIANIIDPAGQISAIPATHWTPAKKMIFEAGAEKAGLRIVYSTR